MVIIAMASIFSRRISKTLPGPPLEVVLNIQLRIKYFSRSIAGTDLLKMDAADPKGGNMLSTQRKNKPPPVEKLIRPRIQADRRKDERTVSHASIMIALENIGFHHESVSMTFNHSKSGMCLETADFFEPGSKICIRPFNGPSDGLCPDSRQHLRTATPAEVRWCREFPDESSIYFRIGVKYF